MKQSYTPPQKYLERYADILVNFGLGHGKGIKKGDVVGVSISESAKPLFFELQKTILKAGGHMLSLYKPDDTIKQNFSADFYTLSDEVQISFFPNKYSKGLIDELDHYIVIWSSAHVHALQGIDPKKLMLYNKSHKPLYDWMDAKEGRGKFTWTAGLYGTDEMAEESNLEPKEYWDQISKACFLNKKDPVTTWQAVDAQIQKTSHKLTSLNIEQVRIEGPDVLLSISIGVNRKWVSGNGANIPSFEIFTSPDWRGTNGWIKFNQPLYRYGNLITGIELEFKNGVVVKSKAQKNEKLLKEMIATEGADKVGEFSLTDKRFSRITKFMAHTLYDENIGGSQGNTHIALGNSYHETYTGNEAGMKASNWKKLGFNDSAIHTDIVSTAPRTVTATLPNGKEKVIYTNGMFTV